MKKETKINQGFQSGLLGRIEEEQKKQNQESAFEKFARLAGVAILILAAGFAIFILPSPF